MVAWEWRAPVGKNADKLAVRKIVLHVSLGQVRKAQTFERSLQEKTRAVEHELPFDTNVEFAPVLFELPCVQAAAMGRQAQVEAVVAGQILGRLGPLAFGKVRWRADDSHAEVGTDPNGYHILGDKLTGADTCIDLLRHDVSEPRNR